MERMTIRGDHGVYMAPGWDFHIDPDDYELVQKVLDRLAAYEDTGLEPEKIYALKDGHCAGCSVPVLTHERQCELAKADREGRCVVLPMPVPCYSSRFFINFSMEMEHYYEHLEGDGF